MRPVRRCARVVFVARKRRREFPAPAFVRVCAGRLGGLRARLSRAVSPAETFADPDPVKYDESRTSPPADKKRRARPSESRADPAVRTRSRDCELAPLAACRS